MKLEMRGFSEVSVPRLIVPIVSLVPVRSG